ncbi:MAG: tRNA 2-thiouridine(34) synthase MnmA [Candidatus Parcubacteria bacterium]|nr:tRNA 2-thiouridine(34) synthase MnmA [Candidatus Parcubacteria bacterium]
MKKTKKPKIFVAMSGGVDSSVAALLLKQKNYDLVGCFIKGWYPSGLPCEWKKDRRDAMRVCAKLGILFLTINAEKEYKREVVDYMLREYKAGRTPNPDVMCNRYIKFGVFLKKALAMGADYIATGHYVKISNLKNQISNLFQARDKNKDQSYFLWTLTQKQLKHCLFPLGGLLKPEVRVLAKKFNLPTAEKRESMGVCFIGEFDIKDFLKKYIKPKKGRVMRIDGKIIGEHEGVQFYTIGQRHGFSPGGGVPYYIVAKDIKKNILFVSDKAGESEFYKKEVKIRDVNWISGSPPAGGAKNYKARIRYRQPLQTCKVKKNKIIFSKPQRAVTSGQSLVLYDIKEMLGGGIIV